MNNEMERIWKEALVTYKKYYQGIWLEEPRKTTIKSQNSQSPSLELNTSSKRYRYANIHSET
jgi:hypothetical protein